MRKRHLKIALELPQLGVQGLAELRGRGELTAEECEQLVRGGHEAGERDRPGR